ncbi:hypothetical protein K0M31_001836 [Melipona bicolor]|uniref:Uncharacterized protein n=1 Tax=Melipona bicolor TaxID=60889 RepID=A0AA40GGM5_9HYME|nr:hypothetical protein K0M31_001836 [Melipona bicolor]
MADSHQLREDVVAMQHQLVEITHRMANMEANISRRRPIQRRSQSRGRRSPARQHITTGGFCYYHFNYGARTHKCKKPCNWPSLTAEVA